MMGRNVLLTRIIGCFHLCYFRFADRALLVPGICAPRHVAHFCEVSLSCVAVLLCCCVALRRLALYVAALLVGDPSSSILFSFQ